jgi:lipopolysaccharide export system permease protein
MKSLTRYIIAELLKTFCLTLTAMTVLTVLLFVAQEGLKQGLSARSIVQLVPYIVPNALYVAIPGTMLFTACLIYGRMSADNEIIAIQSSGISPMRMMYPVLVLATLLSLLTVWLNDVAVSWGRDGIYQVVLRSVEQTVYSTLSSNHSFSNDHVSISVASVNDRQMIFPSVVMKQCESKTAKTINAETAELHCDLQRGMLSVTLRNGTVNFDQGGTFHFDEIAPEISLTDLTRKDGNLHSPSNYPLHELDSIIEQQAAGSNRLRKRLAMNAGLQMLGGDLLLLKPQLWQQHLRAIENTQTRAHRLKAEPWRRWANGFSCLFFAMVGAPLAIRLKNADVWTSFGVCFIPILLVYFPLMLLALDRAKSGAVPPQSIWFGNVILLIVSIYLLRKTIKA